MSSHVGLPPGIRCCLFDLDGVVTSTAQQHARAWKSMFDAFLIEHEFRTGLPLVPFEITTDYIAYVDGKTRQDGTRSFLASRGIALPDGDPDDHPGVPSVHGLSNHKNEMVLYLIAAEGIAVYDDSVTYLRAVRAAGMPVAVVTSSANAEQVLDSAGIADLFDVRIDALVAAAQGLAGKPAPDTFLSAARLLGYEPEQAAVFEDALAGVEAGIGGGFGCVVGVDRTGHAEQLLAGGADVVVTELTELLETT